MDSVVALFSERKVRRAWNGSEDQGRGRSTGEEVQLLETVQRRQSRKRQIQGLYSTSSTSTGTVDKFLVLTDGFAFQFGESQKLRLVRILRSTVMVRVGGGWVALDEFLVKNDPCRGDFIHLLLFTSRVNISN